MIYLIVFSISIILFSFWNEKFQRNWILIGLAMLPAILLATYRGDSVGIDILVYVKKYFYIAGKANDFMEYSKLVNTEIGYKIINYLVAQITNRLQVLHFLNQILIMFPVVLALKKSKITQLWFGMLVFYFMFYNVSLNAVRQGIACGWFFLATIYVLEKEYKKGIGVYLFAGCFHLSAILMAALVFSIVYIFNKEKVNKNLLIIGGAFFIIAIIKYDYFLNILLDILPVQYSIKYAGYIGATEITSGIGYVYILNKIMCVMILLLLCKKKVMVDLNKKLLVIHVLAILLIPIANNISFGYRLIRYIDYFAILIYPQTKYIFKNNKINHNIANGYVVAYMLIYWIMTYVVQNNGRTLPYILIA